MHFKAKPWEFERVSGAIIDPLKPGLYLFNSYDSYLDVYFSLRLKNLFIQKQIAGNLKKNLGDEITSDWVDQHLDGQGFFDTNDSHMILMAEKLDKQIFFEILKKSSHLKDNFLILNFSKESALMDEAAKIGAGTVFSVIKPMFWENEKLFDFICKILKMNLTGDIRKFLLTNLAPDTSNYITQLSILRKMFMNWEQVSIEDLKDVLLKNNFDYFAYASKFSKKDTLGFTTGLVNLALDFDELNSFFAFMIRHMMKLMDALQSIDRVDGKKINNYQKELIACSKLWSRDEIKKAIRNFSLWQMMSRSKDPMLKDSFRSYYLNNLS